MRFRALDSNGDWSFGRGRASYAVDSDAIALDLRTGLHFFRGDAFWRMEFGIDWWTLNGSRGQTAQAQAILECRQMILSRAGVARIENVFATLNPFTRRFSVQFRVWTVFSQEIRDAITV